MLKLLPGMALAVVYVAALLGAVRPAAAEQLTTVRATEFRFEPSTVIVKRGQTLNLEFKNEGVAAHNLTIDGLGLRTKTIQSGNTDVLRFSPGKTGTFRFVCSVPGHAEAGMVGTLIVK